MAHSSMNEITLLDHMGDDLAVVNAARVSFGKRSESLTERDKRLIGFLARGCTQGDWNHLIDLCLDPKDGEEMEEVASILNHVRRIAPHWTPFGQANVKLHMKMPICIARQWMRSTVGMVPNEISRRYVSDTPEFTHPDLRLNAPNVKQGSSDEVLRNEALKENLRAYVSYGIRLYDKAIEMGVAPEVARFYLPQGVKTEIIANGTLAYWARVCNLRKDPHAQEEVRDVANKVSSIIETLFPVSWKELTR